MSKSLVEVKFDKAKLKRIEKTLKGVPGAMPKVMTRGINRTATMSRTEIIRRISANVSLKKKTIRDGLQLEKAHRNKWAAKITVISKRIPLMDFKARQGKRGVSYLISKNKGRQKIQDAFFAKLKSGHEGVFKRLGKSRLPICELFGPSLGQVFSDAGKISSEVQAKAGPLLEKNINDQVKMLLAKRGAA